jgi:hypothetical protein
LEKLAATIATWGSTAAERAEEYPCDSLLADPDDVLFRAVDVAAPPSLVFRWLCQLRAAPYSYDWIDNFGRTSPRTLTSGLDELAVGQRVMRIFRLAAFEPGRHLTLVLHDAVSRRFFGEIAVTYRVAPTRGGSRLVVKLRIHHPEGAFRLLSPLLAAGDLVMMRKQLFTLKALAERDASARAVR